MMDEIALVPYDPRWPSLFDAEEARLRATLPSDLILDLQHFGSTAIPGLVAKPVIDILIAVPVLADARTAFVPALEQLGYAFWADNPKTDRLFFVKGLPPAPQRTHHVHVAEPDAEPWRRLPFRDYLRMNAEAASRYAALKLGLATRHRHDREAYTAAKEAFVQEILVAAGAS